MFRCLYDVVPNVPRRDDNLKEATEETAAERLWEHPLWLRMEDTLVRALEPFAEARAAVALVLAGMRPVNST